MQKIKRVKVTKFAKDRHFSKTFGGTRIGNFEVDDFENFVNDMINSYDYDGSIKIGMVKDIKDGYAPFCKEVCIKNFTDAKTGVAEITMENHQYLRSRYSGRRNSELGVLTRSLNYPERRFIPSANYLILILYSREQCLLEHKDMVKGQLEEYKEEHGEYPEGAEAAFPFEFEGDDTEWGIVSIMGQLNTEADPINPATMTRNHLGKKFGGSGVKINPKKYNESVNFWNTHAIVR